VQCYLTLGGLLAPWLGVWRCPLQLVGGLLLNASCCCWLWLTGSHAPLRALLAAMQVSGFILDFII
jgi:hypothetical protein